MKSKVHVNCNCNQEESNPQFIGQYEMRGRRSNLCTLFRPSTVYDVINDQQGLLEKMNHQSDFTFILC
jgi:hypothetical protein